MLALALAVVVSAGASPEKRSRTVTLRPVADAFVSSSRPRANFGKSRTLGVDRRPSVRTYLRFRIPVRDRPVRSATLRLYVTLAHGRGIRVAAVRPGSWAERAVTFAKAPRLGRTVARTRGAVRGWISLDVTKAVGKSGVVDLGLVSSPPNGVIRFASRERSGSAPRLVVTSGRDPIIAAAGNIACDPAWPQFNGGNGTATDCRDKDTAALLDKSLAAILTLGDAQYDCGGAAAYAQAYNRAWGRFKSITHPVPGNHDYVSSGGTGCDPSARAAGYFGYFGAAAGTFGKSYYSFDVGSWHVVALDSECTPVGGCGPGSPEEQWLRADLAAHPNRCTLAYWHYPIFSSGEEGGTAEARTFWQDLDQAGADVVLNAHEHDYERFAPQDVNGKATANGMREFVIGTGGRMRHAFVTVRANSQVRNNAAWGVLKLTLHPASYDWRFVPAAGATFTDSGSARCR